MLDNELLVESFSELTLTGFSELHDESRRFYHSVFVH